MVHRIISPSQRNKTSPKGLTNTNFTQKPSKNVHHSTSINSSSDMFRRFLQIPLSFLSLKKKKPHGQRTSSSRVLSSASLAAPPRLRRSRSPRRHRWPQRDFTVAILVANVVFSQTALRKTAQCWFFSDLYNCTHKHAA